MKFWQKIIIVIVICIVILYILGPSPSHPVLSPDLPVVPQKAINLEKFVGDKEAAHPVKPDNEARIIWANDSLKNKTKYCIVYLHGFSASQEEGDPLHKNIAKTFGCNLYLSRLSDHGLDTVDAMINFNVKNLWSTAKEALAIGKSLGDSVILMGTSTGGTLNLLLATQHPEIKGLINLSPNIRVNNPSAFILNNHWGLQVARIVMNGNDFVSTGESEAFKKYWYSRYRLEALTELQELLEDYMVEETFEKVKQPVLNLYYYKNEQEQDKIVRVDKILEMHKSLATPESLKVAIPMPDAGDHVLGSQVKSKDIDGVQKAVEIFIIERLKINKI